MLTPRFAGPRRLVRGLASSIQLPVYDGAFLTAPTSGTYTLKKNGAATTVTGAVTITSSIATYALGATVLDALGLDTDYIEEWELVIGALTYIFRRDVYLCKRDLYSVLTDQDLFRVHSDLPALMPSTMTSYESYREEAWEQLMGILISKGNFPQLVTNSWAFRAPHLYLTLSLIAGDFATAEAGQGKWSNLTERYNEKFEKAWDNIQLDYDSDEDGNADSRRAGVPVYYLQGQPRRIGWM